MTFEELPEDWETMPLTDPILAGDAVDLFLGDKDRHASSMLALLCDEEHRALQPIIIDGIDWRCTTAKRKEVFKFISRLPVPAVAIAVSAPFPIPTVVADRWRRTMLDVCGDGGPELVHFFSAVPHRQPVLLTGIPATGIAV